MPADLSDFLPGAVLGAGVSLALAGAAWLGRTLTVSGVLAAVGVGTAVWTGLGWRGFAVLAAFFVLASALTRTGYRRKAAAGLAEGQAEGRGGRRTASQVLANGGVAAVAAGLAAFAPGPLDPAHDPVWALAFAGALATAAADTAGTEVGQLLRRRTFLITNLRRVPPGTDGGLSLPGTAAALGAALLLGALGAALGLYPPSGAWAVAAAGFGGATADSLLGATLERRGLLDNDRVNLLATLAGAVLGVLLGGFLL